MTLRHGPSVVTNGLTFMIDAAQGRSYSGSGTAWIDVAGNTTGVISGSPTYRSTNLGYFTMVPASATRVDFNPSSASINITNNITLDAWVYPNSYINYGGIMTYGTGTGEQYSLGTNTTNSGCFAFSCNYPSAWTFFYGPTSSTSTWYHVAVTFASGSCNLYLNGALAASGTITPTSLTAVSGAYLVVGDNHPGGQEYFDGNIAMCRIYNTVLSYQDLLQNFNAHRGRYGV